ncbi:MAG: efflux RND transporter periplasmic adaptor subunit [Alphaproteobacteria bacterium]|nr:efflux RND transporter periplasmic adaptor subunit [Alphaproteobacteria bacterium]
MTSTRASLLSAAALAVALSACGDGGGDAANLETTPDPVIMASSVVEQISIEQPIVGTGTMAPLQSTDLGPRVDGIIEEIFVRVGQRVSKDDPLFRTRDTELKLKVSELENELKLASATAKQASRDFNRISKLHKRGNASAGALDKSRAAHESAQARFGIAEAKLGQIKQALEDAIVKAPFDGVITARNVHEGTFMATRMGGGGMMGPSGVVQIMEIHIVAAIVDVPEVHLSKFGVGTRAKVIIDGLNDEFESEVHRINDYIDPVKRTIQVRIGIANDDYRIKPGSFARAMIYPPAREVLTLPRGAVLGFEEQRYVFVEENGIAKRRPVRTAQLDAERVVVLEGLSQGTEVLSGPGLRTLVEDDPVTVLVPGEPIAAVATDEPA